ncbi:glycosyltransferase [Sphingomonas sp. HH69]
MDVNPAPSPLSLAGRRIGLLTASVSRLGGGVFEAVVQQADLIRRCGGEVVIFGLADRHAEADRPRFAPSHVHLAPVQGPPQIGYSRQLLSQLLDADLDLLHLHGIWMYPSRAAMLWARRIGRPYVISPHGMLDPWIVARGRAKKAIARIGYERASWRSATRLHGLTVREAQDIARESGRTDSVVIANAGPTARPAAQTARPPRFAYLGRIHPKKNLDALVAAWKQVAGPLAAAGAELTIAGWGEDEDVAQFKAALTDAPPSIRFVGPLYGEDKARLLADARFLILPSHSEGLPMVILEAWAAGTPTLMTSECNLPEGFASGAAIECGYTAQDLAPLLERAATMIEGEWLAMAAAAHGLATGPFAASGIEARWSACYRELIEAARLPAGTV